MSAHRSTSTRNAIRVFAGIGLGATTLYGTRLLLNFFGPQLAYRLPQTMDCALDAPEFVRFLSLVTNGAVHPVRITRLRNGSEFYPSQMEAIGNARESINLETYEFEPGRVADEMLAALCERARAGVQVRLVIDALGSFRTPDRYFDPLRAAGGSMRWYHPLNWNTWPQANNRTHRKLLTVDGRIGFIGGAGVADYWRYATEKVPVWRDTFLRVEGAAVGGLLSTFAENWLESAGEILSGAAQFSPQPAVDGAPGFVVLSTPHGGGTQARVLFQALITSACRSLRITTPYFLPDRSARQALIDAVRRGVRVEILTAGPYIDHPFVRRLSQRSSRKLLEAAARIYEYQPAMIHAKLMTVDEQWCVAGSTNFDHRSFALNDEVNLAVLDPQLAGVLDQDFRDDLEQSRPLTLAMLRRRRLLRTEDDLLDDVVAYES